MYRVDNNCRQHLLLERWYDVVGLLSLTGRSQQDRLAAWLSAGCAARDPGVWTKEKGATRVAPFALTNHSCHYGTSARLVPYFALIVVIS